MRSSHTSALPRAARLRNRLRAARASRAITQLDTALDARIPFSRYFKIEHGIVKPTVGEMRDLARVLDVSVSALFPLVNSEAA